MLQWGYDTIAPQTNEEKIMVFTPYKNAPVNVISYKLERMINYMRWNHASEYQLQILRAEFEEIIAKIQQNIKLTDRQQTRLESLNTVM